MWKRKKGAAGKGMGVAGGECVGSPQTMGGEVVR